MRPDKRGHMLALTPHFFKKKIYIYINNNCELYIKHKTDNSYIFYDK